MKKVYYLCRFYQQSPLRLSNGESEVSDCDIMRDSTGKPYIPGSSLAGVLRSYLDEEEANALFGCPIKEDAPSIESRVIVTDAVIRAESEEAEYPGSFRDSVCIVDSYDKDGNMKPEGGTAKDSGKLDFEVMETRDRYEAVIEIDGDEAPLLKILSAIHNDGGRIAFGGKTSRGFGKMTAFFRRKEFDLETPEGMSEWLDYDPMSKEAFNEAFDGKDTIQYDAGCSDDGTVRISGKLKLKGGFIIRVYTESDDDAKATGLTGFRYKTRDEIEKKAKTNEDDDLPIIPGTTWAGVFLHHMLDTAVGLELDSEAIESVKRTFGRFEDGKKKQKSRITFDESVVTDTQRDLKQGSDKKGILYTRNALDRFTMAPRDGALYTERYYYGGTCELNIRIEPGYDENKKHQDERLFMQLLSTALLDLHYQLLHFGGEGGIGRGLAEFESLEVNGRDVMDDIRNCRVFLPDNK